MRILWLDYALQPPMAHYIIITHQGWGGGPSWGDLPCPSRGMEPAVSDEPSSIVWVGSLPNGVVSSLREFVPDEHTPVLCHLTDPSGHQPKRRFLALV